LRANTRKKQPSFRNHLTTIVTIGVVGFAITASLTTALVTSNNLNSAMVRDGLQVTGSLAEQSVLALLYGSGENAEDAVRVTMAFPSVSHVMILTSDYQPILSRGVGEPNIQDIQWSEQGPELVWEDMRSWVFVAPVYTGNDEPVDESTILLQQEMVRELVGFVLVVKKKDKLREIQALTIVNNLGIGLLTAILLVVILRRRLDHLTKPLDQLAQAMRYAEQGDSQPYAETHGPREVQQIARAFNQMMVALAERDQRLREQNEQLENEVAIRTEELVYARDMAIQANQNKSDFLANVTHELRTPLQAIIGYSDLISEVLPPDEMEEVHHDLECILNNAQNLLNLITGILDLSKVESGHMDITLEPVNIERLVKQVAETVRQLMEKNQNTLKIEVRHCNQEIEIDGVKLRQILLNLLSNAGKFTENGKVELQVDRDEQGLMLRVRDSGIGISDSAQTIIFDAFRQVDGSATRKYQGTGLGLAITKKFGQLMGGDIAVESELGQGSVFTVKIPLPIKI